MFLALGTSRVTDLVNKYLASAGITGIYYLTQHFLIMVKIVIKYHKKIILPEFLDKPVPVSPP